MTTASLSTRVGSSSSRGSLVLGWLREHPLLGYFFLAFGLQWVWPVPMYIATHLQLLGHWVLLSPTLAGFIMAWVTGGRAGLIDLPRRCIRWRVGPRWYAVTLLTMPMLILAGLVASPGAVRSFQLPGISFLATYLFAVVFGVSGLFAAGIGEEPGWPGRKRGGRNQARAG